MQLDIVNSYLASSASLAAIHGVLAVGSFFSSRLSHLVRMDSPRGVCESAIVVTALFQGIYISVNIQSNSKTNIQANNNLISDFKMILEPLKMLSRQWIGEV